MTKQHSAVVETIWSEIHNDSINSNFLEIETRRAEERLGWFVSSPGVLIEGFTPQLDQIHRSDEYFRTGKKLTGLVRTLNGNTTIVAQSLRLPKDMSRDGIEAFLYDFKNQDEVSRTLGYISLNEPGFPLLKPIKSEIEGYLETKNEGKALAAEAIGKYLNTPEGFGADISPDEIREQIEKTYDTIESNRPTFDELLEAMQDGITRLYQQEAYDTAHPEETAANRMEAEKAIKHFFNE